MSGDVDRYNEEKAVRSARLRVDLALTDRPSQ
jgi:hypothetical protein